MTRGSHTRLAAMTIAASLWALPASAQAPDAAICSLQQAIACTPLEPCERALPAAVNLPALLRFDVSDGVIESRREDGAVRTSKIDSSSDHSDALVLQGNDDGHPWAMRIDRKDGSFTLNVLRGDEAFVGFGVCSAKMLK